MKEKINELSMDLEVRESVNKGWSRHAEFLKLYPFRKNPGLIDKLTPDKVFNPGKQFPEYFFYWIEHALKPLGHLGIGSSLTWVNARNNINELKALLKIVMDESLALSEKVDATWGDIKGFGSDKHIAKKIIFCYYPEKVMPIFKTDHIEHFVGKLGFNYRLMAQEKYKENYDFLSIGQKFQFLNELLFDYKEQKNELRKWDSALFSGVLYKAYPNIVKGFSGT